MKESYRKGVANHPDPEPCGGGGNGAPEALDRGRCRLGIPEADELRNSQSRGADGVRPTGRQRGGARDASASPALRSRRPHACTETPRARTERPCCHPQSKGGGSVGEGDEL